MSLCFSLEIPHPVSRTDSCTNSLPGSLHGMGFSMTVMLPSVVNLAELPTKLYRICVQSTIVSATKRIDFGDAENIPQALAEQVAQDLQQRTSCAGYNREGINVLWDSTLRHCPAPGSTGSAAAICLFSCRMSRMHGTPGPKICGTALGAVMGHENSQTWSAR